MKTSILAILALAASAPLAAQDYGYEISPEVDNPAERSPAEVQAVAIQMQNEYLATAKNYARTVLDANNRIANGSATKVDAAKDPWKLVTQQSMLASTEDPYFRVPNYSLAVQLDFNGDGQQDVARMYNNSKQGAVVVTYGGSGKREIVYKTDRPFANAEQIFAAGNRIVVNYPEVSAVVLVHENGKPQAYAIGM